jgi:hypothetical protein
MVYQILGVWLVAHHHHGHRLKNTHSILEGVERKRKKLQAEQASH